MTRISILTLLCQSSTPEELETTAREMGCTALAWRYSALHLCLPDGTEGSLRAPRDAWHAARGIPRVDWVWCEAGAAE